MAGIFRSFAVLPAAGESRRMGRPKLLLPWRGSTVIERVLAVWQASDVERIVVVISPADHTLAEVVRGERVDVVIPQSPPPDMKASVLWALDHVERAYQPHSTDAWLLAPADLPHLTPTVINEVLRSYNPQSPAVLVPTLLGQRGHPVLFPWQMVAEARALRPPEGLNALLRRNSWLALPCDDVANAKAWQDLDTPEDYQSLANGSGD